MAQPSRKPAFSDAEIFRFVKEFVEVLAQELGVSRERIFGAIRRRIPHGEPGRPPNQNKKRQPIDLHNDRVQTIIAMVKQRKLVREIGRTFGITRERVYQIIARIKADHGDGVLASELVPVRVAAEQFAVTYDVLLRRCRRGAIPCQKIGKRYYFTPDEFSRIPDNLLLKKQCCVCETQFSTNSSVTKTCSVSCRKKRDSEYLHHYAAIKPTPENCSPRLCALMERLKEHTIPENEEWLVLKNAVRCSNVTRMQLSWLTMRHVLTTRPDPVRCWRGDKTRPVMLFAASELDIVREVYEEWKKDGSPRSLSSGFPPARE